jgi:raffinose/stachyose/melibiose transport system permease protein
MSFRTTADILNDPFGLPKTLDVENYGKLLFDPEIGFMRYFINSIVVSVGALAVTLILSTMGGYGFGRSRYQFKFRGPLFSMLLFALMLPPQIFYIPQFTMMSKLGLLNTYWSLILIYAATALPVSTYLMSTYFSQLPSELEDASQIDGCTHFQTFWHVMLPLARPAIMTVTLMNFMSFWNELLLAITMVTDPKMRTIQAAMMMFVGEHGSNYAIAAASLALSMLPTLLLYLVMSDKFIEGLTAGAVKG